MAIQGLIGTGNFGADERPKNWLQGILMRFPNGHAPITALTSQMKKKVTDDPEFAWWEREVSNLRLKLGANAGVGTTVVTVADPYGFGGSTQIKAGDLLLVEESGELMLATADGDADGEAVTVSRSYGTVAATEVLYDGAAVNPHILVVGSIYEEGADTPNSVRYRASKKYNFTQIFRDSLKATRTAMQTRLRTIEEVRDAKQQALLYHTIRMEHGFIFGERVEGTGSGGEPMRSTGGIIEKITQDASAQVVDFSANPAAPTGMMYSDLENIMLEAFRFGSQEKMCFIGNRALLAVQRAIRMADAVSVEITPAQKEFGMDVRRLFSPYGTLVLKTHPLFNQNQSALDGVQDYLGMDSWLMILDMADLTYRPLRNSDTQYLPDRQGNGIDGLTSEYLTECGLQINHGKHHYLVRGVTAAAAES